MDESMNDGGDAGQARRGGSGEAGGREREGEQRTTAAAESERLRSDEKVQTEHPDMIGGRGRATGEPPFRATDEDADPRDPTT
jgi:hypothetical protein